MSHPTSYISVLILNRMTAAFCDTAQKMKFSIKDFVSKCDKIRRKLRIWLRLLKKSLMENFIFCAVRASFFNPFHSTGLFQ